MKTIENYIKAQILEKFPAVEFYNEIKEKDGFYHVTIVMTDWSTLNLRNSIFEVVSIENRNNTYVELKVESSYLEFAVENNK